MDRLSSGQPHLDEILGGGLPANAINLLIGLPGTGKTMLAQQYIFANASTSRPALYFTTASEPLDKLVRYGQSLDFFDSRLVGSGIFYEDLGPALQKHGLDAALELIVAGLRDRRPGFLVIDSFKALDTYAADALAFRRFVIELAGRLSSMATNVFWVGEYDVTEVPDRPEFAVADSIIALAAARAGSRTLREMQILKLRGTAYRSGAHTYRLSSNGLRVFPRLADPAMQAAYGLATERVGSGVPELDEMLGGGLWPGSATLIAGPSGSGKTLLSLEMLRAAMLRGERAVFASLQENPTQVARVLDGYGWRFDENVEVMYRSPVDVYIDEWVYDLLETVDRTGAKRVAIDSLTDLRVTSPDDVRFHEYVFSLIQRCSRSGITLVMTHEIHDLFGVTSIIESDISHLADNLVLLQYAITGSAVERNAMVLKTRASQHDPRVQPFVITSRGIVFGGPKTGERRATSIPPEEAARGDGLATSVQVERAP